MQHEIPPLKGGPTSLADFAARRSPANQRGNTQYLKHQTGRARLFKLGAQAGQMATGNMAGLMRNHANQLVGCFELTMAPV